MSFFIIYSDDYGNNVDICNDSKYVKQGTFDIPAYMKDHPARFDIVAVFDSCSNLIEQSNKNKCNFEKYCLTYGFDYSDYNAPVFKTVDGYITAEYVLIGFNPRNTKYKAILKNVNTGILTKATLGFVKSNIRRQEGYA